MSQRPLGCLFEVVETLVLTLIIFLVIQNFVAQPYRVQQQSMEHTLEPNQYVLVDKLTPHFNDYKRGDIVVFNPPAAWAQGDGTPFIKRVIGLGGDTVDIHDNHVFINGVQLNEPYIFDGQDTTVTGDQSSWVIPAGDLFVMGDHRANS
ncbi:MAG TPA: signal peptidase I, partial [Candidatus Saccharimonadales bacterium]|nr:signal peptidase I [Candidatus Saccharimonadales bacterium]